MTNLTVAQPPLIDAAGNINVHGREGISIPIARYTDSTQTTEINIAAQIGSWTFEVEGIAPFSLQTNPNDPLGLMIVIANLKSAGIAPSPTTPVPFVLRDASGAVPIVRWEGNFVVRGWED